MIINKSRVCINHGWYSLWLVLKGFKLSSGEEFVVDKSFEKCTFWDSLQELMNNMHDSRYLVFTSYKLLRFLAHFSASLQLLPSSKFSPYNILRK